MRTGNPRRGKSTAPPDRGGARHPPPTPTTTFNPWNHPFPPPQTRESDASFGSSRASLNPLPRHNDTSAALSTINGYLTGALSLPPIKPPLSLHSLDSLKHLLLRLGFPLSSKLELDLVPILKSLNCPVGFNKSALRAPGERRASAMLIGVIHWLVELCLYGDHLERTFVFMEANTMYSHVRDCYGFYMDGDDDREAALCEDYLGSLEGLKAGMEEDNSRLEGEIGDLKGRIEQIMGRGDRVAELEEEEKVLKEDEKKFETIIGQYRDHVLKLEKAVEEKEKELGVKILENSKICEENEEIRKTVEDQLINARDAERMKRELHAVEREIKDAEVARNDWEEKEWNLGADIGNKLKELEERVIECNQAVRRLKLGSEFQYQLNAAGSTPSKLLGIDYKTTLKPTLAASFEEAKRLYVQKFEELISLKNQATESASRIEAKRSQMSMLAAQIKEVEAQMDIIRKEAQDYTSRCSAEARKIAEDFEAETSNMDIAEGDAADRLKVSKAKLQEAIIQTEEKVQMCARNLFAVVDSVSKFKEHVALKISEMKTDLSETAVKVADAHKYTLPASFQHVEDKCVLME